MNPAESQIDLAIQPLEALPHPTCGVALTGLVERLREKDLALVGHSHRVAFFADLLAHRLRLPEDEVERVRTAAFLHDIGKLGVSREILLKPGKLEAGQVREMRRHPVLGTRMLQDLPLPRDVVFGVLHHHEWWDGSGYPNGLVGERIPLVARIIGVCDAFDSMDSDRPYRRALPRPAVLEEFRNFAGRQFEPALVTQFLRILETGVCDPPVPFHFETDGPPRGVETPAPGVPLPGLGSAGHRALLH